jgi:hypothetical protein
MTIDAGGNIGIGTTSPVGKLHLYQSGNGTNMIDKRTNISTSQNRQTLNYTHYSSVAQGPTRDPDNSRGLWIGNMVDENDSAPSGANFVAFTNSFQFYVVADQTKYDDGLSFISQTDTLKYSDGNFIKAMHIDSGGNVGIGTVTPSNSLHIYKDGAEATSGLFIEKASGGVGTAAALLFGTNAVGENEGIAKAGIFFQRTATNGRGDFQFCLDNVDNATPIGLSNSKMTIKSDGNVGIGTVSPSAPLHVAGGTIINSDGVAKKTYSYSGDLTSGQTVANSTIKITFSAHVFYAKIVAHLVESDNEVSTFSLECGGGNWSGGTPLAIAKGPQAIFGSASTNPWSSTVTTSATTVSFKPTTNMAVAGHYNVFIEYISQSSSGVVSKITEGTTDVVTFGY